MSRDEARRLLGGYATASLTESERTALFQAALEDQELFDELAREQVLKEVLDEPGARQRLLAGLEPRKERAWIWALAGAAAILAIVLLNGAIGFLTEARAERALAALKKYSSPAAKVVRNGSLVSIPAFSSGTIPHP